MKAMACATLLTALLCSAPLEAANLLQNPEFDVDAQGWSALGSAGSFAPDATHGSPATGSVSVSLTGLMDTTYGIKQCVGIAGGQPVTYGARVRQGSVSGSAGIFVLLRTFAGSGCTGTILSTLIATPGGTVPGIPAGQDFTVHQGSTTTAANALSAMLIGNLQINQDGASIQAYFDDMLLDTSDALFADGFE